MNPPKFLFDENIGPPMVKNLSVLLSDAKDDERAEVCHVFELFERHNLAKQGVWDERWAQLASDEGWIIVAADRGRGIGKGQKLPALCRDWRITLVQLSKRVGQRPKFQKLLTILSVWHELIEAVSSNPRGTRFMIEPTSMAASARGRGRLIVKWKPPDQPNPGMLFVTE